MKFVDEAKIMVRSGNGGAGSVHFKRAKFMPRMGPDGGSGGTGGSVYFKASDNVQTLLDFKFVKSYAAEDGENGSKNDCDGKKGQDLVLTLPVGTIVRDDCSGIVLADLDRHDKQVCLLEGGKGGLGNMYFATSTNQAPTYAQPGIPGQTRDIKFELKLLADVALVGFPNAGKSTLISKMSAAKPVIADYPFTTLIPNLGMVRGSLRNYVIADVPGLIEGASEGRGLGHRFLKHCERSKLMLIVLDADPEAKFNLAEQFEILRTELEQFSTKLAKKEYFVAINKSELLGEEYKSELFFDYMNDRGLKKLLELVGDRKTVFISALKAVGLKSLSNDLQKSLELAKSESFDDLSETVVTRLGNINLFSESTRSNTESFSTSI